MPAQGEDKKDLILVCNARGLERVFKPELSKSVFRFGNLEWSRNGETLYATVATPTEKQGIVQLSLGEVPLAGGPVRMTPIVRASVSLDDSSGRFQISISPDGLTIAASTGYFDKGDIDSADHGLFLVDLRDPQPRVTRIQYPPRTGKSDTARK